MINVKCVHIINVSICFCAGFIVCNTKNTASVICGCRIFSYLNDLHFLVYHGVAHSFEQVARKDEVSQFLVV